MPTEAEQARLRVRTAWWLHALRRSSGTTQQEVLKAFGYQATSSLSDLESGQTAPSLEKLRAAARLYDVPLSLLASPPMTDQERIAHLRAGEQLEPEDPLIPLSVLRRLGQAEIDRLLAGDLSALRGEPAATDELRLRANGG